VTLYDVGDLVRCSVECRTLAGVLSDPTTLAFKHKDPSGNVATLTYPTGIVKLSTGKFYYDLAIDEGGFWSIRWNATGVVDAAGEKQLTVRATAF